MPVPFLFPFLFFLSCWLLPEPRGAGRRHAQESGVLCLHHKTNHHARDHNGKVPRR
jgi:hypothetical protein